MISKTTSFEIINVVTPYPIFFLSIPGSVADAAAVNPNGINTPLPNDVSTFSLKTTQSLVIVQKVYLEIFLVVLF